jgi:hypothetical protein
MGNSASALWYHEQQRFKTVGMPLTRPPNFTEMGAEHAHHVTDHFVSPELLYQSLIYTLVTGKKEKAVAQFNVMSARESEQQRV